MDVTVDVVGEDTHGLTVDAETTYADLVRETGWSPQEVTVLVDGTPVPEDQRVTVDHVTILRLIKGGSQRA